MAGTFTPHEVAGDLGVLERSFVSAERGVPREANSEMEFSARDVDWGCSWGEQPRERREREAEGEEAAGL